MSLTSWARSGLRFDVRVSGPDDGPPVVCLHGFPQDGTAYDGVGRLLAEQGCRVLVPDQRGYSPGARPSDPAAYVLDELADDVVALLDAADVAKAHVVGHDWGGAVAWYLGSRRADRVRSLTVLSTPHPAALRAVAGTSTQALRSSYVVFFQVPALPELMARAVGEGVLAAVLRRTGLDAAHAAHYVRRLREPGGMSAALAWYRAIPLSRGHGPGRVGVPTTYVVGRRDPFFSAAAASHTAGLVTGQFTVVELEAGHWLPETQPGAVAEAVLRGVRED